MPSDNFEVYCAFAKAFSRGIAVGVRCNIGTVQLGTVFTAIYRCKSWHIPDPNPQFEDDTISVSVIVEAQECALKIERIEMYRRDEPKAYAGETALLELTGQGLEYVKEGWFLGTLEKATAPQMWQTDPEWDTE